MQRQTLNVHGQLLTLEKPLVMGIINVTPDSFYSGSRVAGEAALRQRIDTILHEGGSIVDLGAYSSRSGAEHISAKEEMERLRPALKILRDEYPELPVSVDTWRSDVACFAIEEYGVGIVNDISGGAMDTAMFPTIARLQVPYILMHMRGTPETMQSLAHYQDVGLEVLDYLIEKTDELRQLGVHDIIIDPGFGFAKTLEQNYQLMGYLPRLREALELPLLIGISRKSMIYRLLNITPEESLTGTTVLHTYALLHGANILRVHDVRAATEAVRIVEQIQHAMPPKEPNLYRAQPYLARMNPQTN